MHRDIVLKKLYLIVDHYIVAHSLFWSLRYEVTIRQTSVGIELSQNNNNNKQTNNARKFILWQLKASRF